MPGVGNKYGEGLLSSHLGCRIPKGMKIPGCHEKQDANTILTVLCKMWILCFPLLQTSSNNLILSTEAEKMTLETQSSIPEVSYKGTSNLGKIIQYKCCQPCLFGFGFASQRCFAWLPSHIPSVWHVRWDDSGIQGRPWREKWHRYISQSLVMYVLNVFNCLRNDKGK